MADPTAAGSAGDRSAWLPVALILAAGSPVLFLAYLPMTDLPQHLAVASMLLHWGDPRFGFEEHFELALTRTLYLLPYGVVVGLAQLVPIAIALRVLVFASVVAYPLGLLAALRSIGRPAALALLAVPLMYNRAFFWGFVNFNLSLGMALVAVALLERDRQTRATKLGLLAVCTAIPFTHLYGIALVAGYVFFWGVVGERRALLRRAAPLAPLAVGGIAWLALGMRAEASGKLWFKPLSERFRAFGHSILGNYADPSDEWLYALLLLALAYFCAGTFPWSAARWRALGRPARVAFLYAALNFVLYWTLPSNTETALLIHFRHALIAVALVSLFASGAPLREHPRTSRAVLAGLFGAALAIHGTQLVRFDREARGFDEVIARVPQHPRLCLSAWDRGGDVVRSVPYHHFHAYVLAARGGFINRSFPEVFWNIPVRVRDDLSVPATPPGWEWRPDYCNRPDVREFYDWMLLRRSANGDDGATPPDDTEFALVYAKPPWELYARRSGRSPDGGPPPR